MRNFLMIFIAAVMVAFGAISMAQSYTPANAGLGDSDNTQDDDEGGNPFHDCHDDGDDGENPGVYDDPDSEDDLDGGNFGEIGDGKSDYEPIYEEDDEFNCRVILPDTSTPSPTPCPSIIYTGAGGSGGSECCPLGNAAGEFGPEGFTCICYDSAGNVIAEGFGGPPCYCLGGGFGCLCDVTNQGGVPDCCVYFGGCFSQTASAADVDCDGSVTSIDAYATLVTLSGFESDVCGGDADCSDAVDAKDTLVVLAVVAGLRSAATC